jgi:hypothetical protein
LVAPSSTKLPAAASVLQLSFDLIKNFGNGKLLGGGARLKTDSEKTSMFPITSGRFLGRSFGSGPHGLSIRKSDTNMVPDFFFVSSLFFGLVFLGVRDKL